MKTLKFSSKLLLASLLMALLPFAIGSCSKKTDDPLIVPPKFSELPDPNNPEPKIEKNPEEINRLRELLTE